MSRKKRNREKEMALAREERIVGTLRSHASQKKKRIEPLTHQQVDFGLIHTYRDYWIKRPDTWINRHKTKNKDTLRIDMIRHVFGIYSCPRFLENVWLPSENDNTQRRAWNRTPRETRKDQSEFISWYLAVAQGKSLYKECTKGILSKKETHMFLSAPSEFNVKQNIWWARAFSESNGDVGLAGKIARSNLVYKDFKNEFWISVMRFFVRFPTTIAEMNDLMDYFVFMLEENENYSLKGRSLEAVRKQCEVWHRFLNKQKTIGGGTWEGCPLDDWMYVQGKDENKIHWFMRQIKTGNDLLKEGQAMRHCVASYKRMCMEGRTSIWSLSSKDYADNFKRNLTIEMNGNYEVVQVRGYANRAARANEQAIVDRWCREHDLRLRNSYWY